VAGRLLPPALDTLPAARAATAGIVSSVRSGAFRAWTVRDVMRGTVLAAECASVFIVGEMIGRRSFIGYDV
jgi:Mitochondrial ATP synthase g subunit